MNGGGGKNDISGTILVFCVQCTKPNVTTPRQFADKLYTCEVPQLAVFLYLFCSPILPVLELGRERESLDLASLSFLPLSLSFHLGLRFLLLLRRRRLPPQSLGSSPGKKNGGGGKGHGKRLFFFVPRKDTHYILPSSPLSDGKKRKKDYDSGVHLFPGGGEQNVGPPRYQVVFFSNYAVVQVRYP